MPSLQKQCLFPASSASLFTDFKTSYLLDASHLSQTCRLLYEISRCNELAIANAVESRSPISLNEALQLAEAQLRYYSSTDLSDPAVRQVRENTFSATRTIANNTTSLSLITDDALRLAKAQRDFISPLTHHYCPIGGEIAERVFEKRLAEALLQKPSTGPFNCFAIRYQASQNIADAARVLILVATSSLRRARPAETACDVHPRNRLLPHEQARILSAWYFFKVYVLSYHLPRDAPLRRELDAELLNMSISQLYMFTEIRWVLTEYMDDGAMEALGIQDPDPSHLNFGITRHRQYADWEEFVENLCKQFVVVDEADREASGVAQESVLGGCESCPYGGGCESCPCEGCEYCPREGGCRVREEGKGLWEL